MAATEFYIESIHFSFKLDRLDKIYELEKLRPLVRYSLLRAASWIDDWTSFSQTFRDKYIIQIFLLDNEASVL